MVAGAQVATADKADIPALTRLDAGLLPLQQLQLLLLLVQLKLLLPLRPISHLW